MRRKTFYTTQEVDTEYDMDFDDLIDLIISCDDSEKTEILELVGSTNDSKIKCNDSEIKCNDSEIKCETLYDEQKLKVLTIAFNRYDLEELQKMLNI